MKPSCTVPLTAVACALVACADSPVVEPGGDRPLMSAQAPTRGRLDFDDEMAAIADEVPGFAGMYLDASGNTIVQLKDVARLADARNSIKSFFARRTVGSARVLSELEREVDAAQAHPVQYSFGELYGWYRSNQARILGASSVTMGDIDERRNRIVIGVESSQAIGPIRDLLSSLNIPDNAFAVEVVPPVTPASSLQNTVRPVVGGLVINSGVVPACTLGYNAVGLSTNAQYFITNAHCTTAFGKVTGHSMGQVSLSNTIGTELIDPALFTSLQDSRCPTQSTCRDSDAALFQYNGSSHAQGGVAWPNVGSINFSTTRWITSGGDQLSGTTVHMIGKNSGHTTGIVTATCADRRTAGTNRWILCEYTADYSDQLGDSGAPVVRVLSDGTLWNAGINWGVPAVFSGFWDFTTEIQGDLGQGITTTIAGAPPPSVSIISGPTTVPPFLQCTWTATVSGGVPPYSTVWSGVFSGSGLTVEGIVSSSGWLTVTVTDLANHSDNDSIWITVDSNAEPPPGCVE